MIFYIQVLIIYHNASLCVWRLRDLRMIANPLAVGPSDHRVERLLKTINLQPSFSQAQHTTSTTSAYVSKAGR